MLAYNPHQRYYLYREGVDMRKGMDSLSGLVLRELGKDPLSGEIFLFMSRSRKQIKILGFEGDGFGLYYKRLEKGTFELLLPKDSSPTLQLSMEEWMCLMKGITVSKLVRRPRYDRGKVENFRAPKRQKTVFLDQKS
jgi:transposase